MSCFHSRVVPSTRRLVIGGAIVLASLGAWTTGPAGASDFTPPSGYSVAPPATEQQRGRTLDGFVIEHLPDGLGRPSDFEYEWEDVSFRSRVWETGPDPEGAFRVDLTIKTLRGEKLTNLEAVKTFLIEYEEMDPDSWELTPVKIGSYDGFVAGDAVFYFVAPGVAAEVTIDQDRFTDQDLLDTAAGFRPRKG